MDLYLVQLLETAALRILCVKLRILTTDFSASSSRSSFIHGPPHLLTPEELLMIREDCATAMEDLFQMFSPDFLEDKRLEIVGIGLVMELMILNVGLVDLDVGLKVFEHFLVLTISPLLVK